MRRGLCLRNGIIEVVDPAGVPRPSDSRSIVYKGMVFTAVGPHHPIGHITDAVIGINASVGNARAVGRPNRHAKDCSRFLRVCDLPALARGKSLNPKIAVASGVGEKDHFPAIRAKAWSLHLTCLPGDTDRAAHVLDRICLYREFPDVKAHTAAADDD